LFVIFIAAAGAKLAPVLPNPKLFPIGETEVEPLKGESLPSKTYYLEFNLGGC
jgi:hypothetical protein